LNREWFERPVPRHPATVQSGGRFGNAEFKAVFVDQYLEPAETASTNGAVLELRT
jgi:hypothetical protein